MEIIEPSKSWSEKCKCNNCHAVLLVDYKDLYKKFYGYHDAYEGLNYNVLFSCPECLTENTITYNGPYESTIPIYSSNVQLIKADSFFTKLRKWCPIIF